MTRNPYDWGGATYPAYDGFLKGDSTVKSAEGQQLQFSQQLMNLFSAQFGRQSSVLNFLNNRMMSQITNPTGLSAQALTAMRTQATDTTAQQYANAQKAAQSTLAAHDMTGLPSGVAAQVEGAIKQGQASDTSAALNNIQLQNEAIKQQNYWNAVNTLGGVASAYNPLGYAGANTGTNESLAGLSEAYSRSQQSGFWNTLANDFGGAFGSAFGKYLGGGGSNNNNNGGNG